MKNERLKLRRKLENIFFKTVIFQLRHYCSQHSKKIFGYFDFLSNIEHFVLN